jgi:hypothetical protein
MNLFEGFNGIQKKNTRIIFIILLLLVILLQIKLIKK